MPHAYWVFLGIIALFFGLMLCFSLFVLPGSGIYRLAGKIFWGGIMLLVGSVFLPIRVNPVSLAAASCLGGPGIGLMLALHFM